MTLPAWGPYGGGLPVGYQIDEAEAALFGIPAGCQIDETEPEPEPEIG